MPQASILDDVSSVIGFTATSVLCAWYGGCQLYVPAKAGPDHPLVDLIGEAALRALVREFGSEHLKIPGDRSTTRYRRDRSISERFAEGWTPTRVADEFGLSLRRVEQLRAELTDWGWVAYAAGRRTRRPTAAE